MRFIYYYIILRWFFNVILMAQQDPIETLFVRIESDASKVLSDVDKSVDEKIRCPNCARLLFKATLPIFWQGLHLEIMCSKCGALVVWPTIAAQVKSRQHGPNKRSVNGD